ncbi:FAD binding domain-containing protein [Aminobacter sp. Piv2-1]|uniref:FAD binding domain-containing protein n=1 Tax=Aminobacter sp. Piv2-1 TaxID=3031122 RepID=UPI0030A32E5E
MKPPLFEYRAPRSLKDAIALLAGDPGAMVLAGGQSLIPALNMRLASPSRLVDIQHIEGLKGISVQNGRIVVKAMTRHRQLELSDAAYRANPLIREAMAHVAHVPIRNRGTVVGSLCHADAAAEMPMVLLATDGSVVAEGPRGRREIAAEDFFQFHMTTTREPDEIITEARFSVLPDGAGWAFEEFTRRHGDYAIAAVAAIVDKTAGRVSLAACGVSSRPVRLKQSEEILAKSGLGSDALKAASEAAKEAVTAPDDMHATTDYRRHLLAALVRRAVEKAASRTK